MRPRVVLLARSMDVGGAETQLVALAIRLQREFSVSVVTFYSGGVLEAPLRDAGVPVHTVNKQGRWDLVRFVARLRAKLIDLAPQVIHSYLGPPNLMAAILRPRGSRLVWGIRASDMDLRHYDWTWSATFRAERLLSGVPDRIVANSDAGRRHVIQAGFRQDRLIVIPNGIDVDRFRPDHPGSSALRAEWLAGTAGPLVGVVARLDPMKDHETFLRAAAQFAAVAPSARFVIVGTGSDSYCMSLKERARALGLVGQLVWAGQRRDIPSVLGALDIVSLSSAFGEGFPNVVGEAMACSRLCAVTDVGDAAIVVGECGAVVPRRDPDALAAAWRRLMDLSPAHRSELGALARARVVNQFSVDAMVARTSAMYRKLLAA